MRCKKKFQYQVFVWDIKRALKKKKNIFIIASLALTFLQKKCHSFITWSSIKHKKIYKAIKKSQKDCKEVEEWKGTKDSGNWRRWNSFKSHLNAFEFYSDFSALFFANNPLHSLILLPCLQNDFYLFSVFSFFHSLTIQFFIWRELEHEERRGEGWHETEEKLLRKHFRIPE